MRQYDDDKHIIRNNSYVKANLGELNKVYFSLLVLRNKFRDEPLTK